MILALRKNKICISIHTHFYFMSIPIEFRAEILQSPVNKKKKTKTKKKHNLKKKKKKTCVIQI